LKALVSKELRRTFERKERNILTYFDDDVNHVSGFVKDEYFLKNCPTLEVPTKTVYM
jgi:hypothetical protein